MNDNKYIAEAIRLYREGNPHADDVVAQDGAVYINNGERFISILKDNQVVVIYYFGENGDVARFNRSTR